ncbi:unnamed protein product [Rotaria socialis]
MYYWAREEDSLKQLSHELKINSPHSTIDWRNFCRDICAINYVNNPQQIGGPGHIVEIDESCFGKRKYQSGRLLKSQWVFDGIDINTKKCFMVPVQQCDAVTLLPILTTYVLPGNLVFN